MLRFSFFRSGGGDWGINPGASHMLREQSQRYGPRHPIFFFLPFFKKGFYVYECFVIMQVCAHCTSLVPTEAHQVP